MYFGYIFISSNLVHVYNIYVYIKKTKNINTNNISIEKLANRYTINFLG